MAQHNQNHMATAGRKLEELALLHQAEEDGAAGEHMKAMWAGQSNILVSVRVRPLMKHDQIKKSCVRVLDSKVVVILDPAAGDKQDILRANRSKEKQYAFDYVFEPGSSQESVYHHTTKFLIHGVLDGFNATVFAYGQTGSGKTHTMIGSESEPGIMLRVMNDLFVHSANQGKQKGVHYKVTVSFLEIYNENIKDLLSDIEEYLDLREDPIKGPVVASITEIEAATSQEIMQLLHIGNSRRAQAATGANETSSRSHAVLQIVVESRDRAPGTVANIKVGKLSLVDLAGSERAANTKNVGARLVEGANINRSLLALGNCINALGEKGNKGNFVPYRDSKLTRLLKDSLGGNCRTVMIANISSAESSFEETLNTLKYANRAKNIKTNVQRNVLNVNYHISEYVQLIDNLRNEIKLLKNQIAEPGNNQPGVQSPGPLNNNNNNQQQQLVANVAINRLNQASTPLNILRESLRSAGVMNNNSTLNQEERMQLRRSLIELEDQNVQNNIEVSKRQLIVVQWSENDVTLKKNGLNNMTKNDFAGYIQSHAESEIVEAWQECEQLRKAIAKNNGMKKNIAKRLRHNEREAEKFRNDIGDKITGEDRRELMELQYQVGRLELENMELEQHRIVHESILKGKDLFIQKLQLQLAVRDKVILRQQAVLNEHNLDHKVGYNQLALLENTLMGDPNDFGQGGGYENTLYDMNPPSPPRNMSDLLMNDVYTAREEVYKKNNNKQNNNNNGNGNGNNHSLQQDVSFISAVSSNNNSKYNNSATVGLTTISTIASDKTNGSINNDDNNNSIPKLDMKAKHNNKHHNHNKHNKHNSYNINDDDTTADEYDVPINNDYLRDASLTSRDRDLIEGGDWSEVESNVIPNNLNNLHNNNPQNNNKINRLNHLNINNKKDIGSIPSVQSSDSAMVSNSNNNNLKKQSSVKVQKSLIAPKNGRYYRSSLGSEDNPQQQNNNSNSNSDKIIAKQGMKQAKANYDGFQIDENDSDDDSYGPAAIKPQPTKININNRHNNKYNIDNNAKSNHSSPRMGIKMPSISPRGILQPSNSNHSLNNDIITPRNVNNNMNNKIQNNNHNQRNGLFMQGDGFGSDDDYNSKQNNSNNKMGFIPSQPNNNNNGHVRKNSKGTIDEDILNDVYNNYNNNGNGNNNGNISDGNAPMISVGKGYKLNRNAAALGRLKNANNNMSNLPNGNNNNQNNMIINGNNNNGMISNMKVNGIAEGKSNDMLYNNDGYNERVLAPVSGPGAAGIGGVSRPIANNKFKK
eukprot:gene13647-18314_t